MRTRTKSFSPIGFLLLAASIALAGCATSQEPTAVRISAVVDPARRADSLLIAARLVPDERSIELLGEFNADARAAFEETRSARIASRRQAVHPDLTGRDIGECLIRGLVILCPLALALRAAALGTASGITHIRAAAREPSLLIPQRHATALATMFNDRATSTALAAHASRFTAKHDGTDPERRLVLRMKAVETWQVRRNWLGIRIVAQAQAFASPGVALTPTQHVYEWAYGPLSEWTEDSDVLVRQALNEALDELTTDIAATYSGSWEAHKPAPPAPDAVAPPAASITASPLAPAETMSGSALPAVGDTWTYRLTDSRRSRPQSHRVSIVSATSDAVVEQLGEDRQPARTRPLKGGYLMRQDTVSLFSPYLAAFDSLEPGTQISKIENMDADFCTISWICSTSARVVGSEIVQVPAGEFDAIKVEVNQSWTSRHSQGEVGGARRLTVWYSPQTKRAVKFSSRGSNSSYIESHFDLELESYALNHVSHDQAIVR